MGSVTRPRGRLPQRVYWMRRAIVLCVALVLVFGIGKLLGGLGSDPPQSATTAATTTAPQSTAAAPLPSSTAPSTGAVDPVTPSRKMLRRQASTPLATPSGSCRVSDVSVVPAVPQAPGGGDIPIILQLDGTEPACNFEVSAKTLAVKITKDDSTVWASWQCPSAIPNTQVVVRSGVPATVPVTWNGKASDDTCSNHTSWAHQGTYHVYSAAMGSTPHDVEFQITKPHTVVRTKTVKPKPEQESPSSSPSQSVSGAASASPKG